VTPLEKVIRQRITHDGPMPLAEYMVLCLTHPQHGYYTTGHPVGGRGSAQHQSGDFITAPEVSQMFGELIGVWCMEVWQALGSPEQFNLVEIGPGRGTLMRDLMRISGALPGFKEAADIYLVEVSPTLREQQGLALSSVGDINWIRDIDDLPEQPSIVIANELLDALPFRQWCKHGEDWLERAVGIVDDKLSFVLRPNRLELRDLPTDHATKPEGTIFETAPTREAFVARIADLLSRINGAALFIDYGHLQTGYGDTFQAVRNHAPANPFSDPGLTDLTSHVDFEPLGAVAIGNGCVVQQPVSQGQFLLSLGLLERAGNLGANKAADMQTTLQQAVERLAAPQGMGELFKVLVFGAPASLGGRWPGTS